MQLQETSKQNPVPNSELHSADPLKFAGFLNEALRYRENLVTAAIGVLSETLPDGADEQTMAGFRLEFCSPAKGLPSVQQVLGKSWELPAHLGAAIAARTGLTEEEARKRLTAKYVARLNDGPWRSTTCPLFATGPDSQMLSVTSNTVPLNRDFAERIPGADFFRAFGTAGRTSGSLKLPLREGKAQIVPNGWYTSLTTAEGKVLFDGFRTGTLINYGEENHERRIAAAQESANSLLLAIALKALNEKSEQEREAILTGSQPLQLKVAAFDLQGRRSTHELLPEDLEGQTVDEQREVLNGLAGTRRLTFTKRQADGALIQLPFTADVKVLLFNYPVNRVNFEKQLGFDGEPEKRNASAVVALLKEAANVEADLSQTADPVAEQTAKKIALLRREVEMIAAEKLYRQPGCDPYKMNSRLSNLARLCGYEVQFNCRSGKDRTGYLDGEAKLVAVQLALMLQGGETPHFDRALTRRESNFLAQTLLAAGGAAIQRQNTGVSGSKVNYVTTSKLEDDPLVKRVGLDNWALFRGLSVYAET